MVVHVNVLSERIKVSWG